MAAKKRKKTLKPKGLLTRVSKKLHMPKWLFVLLLTVLILRIPSFFEPYSYGDELIYLTLGEAVRRGIPLYSGIHDNKPPLLYIIAGIAGSLFWFKAILAIWHLITVYLFWRLTEAMFSSGPKAPPGRWPRKEKLVKVATVIFALLTTIPLLEGNITNAEIFMIGPIIAAFLILFTKKLSPKNLVLAGVLFSVAALFKVPAAFDIPAIIFLWMVSVKKFTGKNFKQIVLNSGYLALGFLTPILATLIWYTLRGAANEYITAAFLQNVGYLSTWRPGDVAKPLLVRNAPLLVRTSVVVVGMLILYRMRKKLSGQFIFTTSWLLLALFAATLSERPYPHYLIQPAAPISILAAVLFTQKTLEQSLAILPLTLAFFVPVYFKFWYYPTTTYYVRFVKLAAGQISKDEYLSTFGSHVLRNYKIADYLARLTKKDDRVFVWGDGVAIYALSRRLPPIKYVADYHIADFSSPSEVMAALDANMPAYIIVLPDSLPFPELKLFLRSNYGLAAEIEGARVWKLLSPKIRALIAP